MRSRRFGQMTAIAAVLAAAVALPALAQQSDTKRFQVFFDWNQSVLTPEARQILNSAAAEFKKTGVARIDLVGHTDTTGPKDYNLRLSERRADAVKAELVRLGVPGGIITTKGVGFADLLVPTGPNVRELKNRRVEITAPVPPAKPVAAAPAPAPAAAPPPPPKKWSVSLGPWYGYNFRESDRTFGDSNNHPSANLVGGKLGVDYEVAKGWLVGVDGTGFNTIGTSINDGWGGRFAFNVTHEFNTGRVRPYIGPSVGYYTGSGVQDGVFVGPKLGVKFDISDTLFAYGQIAYDNNFRNDFGQGVANTSIGAGYRF
ncbi:MAG: OmpA family protein [Rhodospirillales bacterium]|nr:OmpA family protein [Rhodospirillales bacterium]